MMVAYGAYLVFKPFNYKRLYEVGLFNVYKKKKKIILIAVTYLVILVIFSYLSYNIFPVCMLTS